MMNIHVLMYDHNLCVDVWSEFMSLCMMRIHVLMYDQNSCVYAWSEFMCWCMIRIHVLMYDQSSCVDVWSEFMCWCMIRVYVLMYDLLRSHNYFRDDLLRHTKSTYFPIRLLNCYDSVVFVFVILFTTVIAVNDEVPLEKIISPWFFLSATTFCKQEKNVRLYNSK
jgi:hypothetical protein